jgi:hypothetical protein
MRTSERLRGLKAWVDQTLCEGREMKTPAPDGDITRIERQRPKCYLAWYPTRPDQTGRMEANPANACPGILIMPNASKVKDMEEKGFDRYNKVYRPQELGQELSVSILFSVYEPGIRLPGFIDSADSPEGLDMSLIQEATEEGLLTLLDWMDDCKEALLNAGHIPKTDLFVREESAVYSLYTDQSFVMDKRPIFYGFVNVIFGCYADAGVNPNVNQYLE